MYYYSLNDYIKREFGEKLYKIALDAGMTCPNRDGTLGTRGCIFCSQGGSGDFTDSAERDTDRQIELAKRRIQSKYKGERYIAYFQSYTNTYAETDRLRALFTHVILRDDIAALSIATRPDCLPDDVVELIAELNRIKPVWVELGFQTSNEETAKYIRRGYKNDCFASAVKRLEPTGVHIVVHVILGLPNESREDMLNTVDFVAHSGANGIKLQLLHVLKGTDLLVDYQKGLFKVLTAEEYIDILCECIEHIPANMVVHRLTGDGPKKLLAAPEWSADKKRVLNAVNAEFRRRNTVQGSKYIQE